MSTRRDGNCIIQEPRETRPGLRKREKIQKVKDIMKLRPRNVLEDIRITLGNRHENDGEGGRDGSAGDNTAALSEQASSVLSTRFRHLTANC